MNWKWFGNAGHFICGSNCRFHMCTQVGDYLVSTVGQLWPSRVVREIHAQVYDSAWLAENKQLLGDDFEDAYMKRFGYEEIGLNRTFETMVFKAGTPCKAKSCNCGLPVIDGDELDSNSYNNAKDATEGHMELCDKWALELLCK